MTLYEYWFNSTWSTNMKIPLPPDTSKTSNGYMYFESLLLNKMEYLSTLYEDAVLNYSDTICDNLLNAILSEYASKIIIFINRVNNLAETYTTTESISDDSGYAGFDKDNQDGIFQNKLISRMLNDPKIQLELTKDEIANIPDEIISYYVSRIIPSMWDGCSDLQ